LAATSLLEGSLQRKEFHQKSRIGNPELSRTGKPKAIKGDCWAQPTHFGGLDPQHLGYHRRLSQSNSVAFESALSRDRVGSVSTETRSNQSLSRVRCMTRSSSDPLHDLDLEIEINLCRLRKARSIVVSNSDSSNSFSSFDNSTPITNTFNSFENSSNKNFAEPKQMENNDRTLKELTILDVVYQSWYILYPQLELAPLYELKSGLTHLLLPCGLFHNAAARDTGGLYKNEGISIFLGWSYKGLTVSIGGSLQHLVRHEAHVSREVLSSITSCNH
ncbi:hypothetical protein CR513_49226, partial [Mucuna pruriens]